MFRKRLLFTLIIFGLFGACVSAPAPTPTAVPTNTPVPTQTPAPTPTSTPTPRELAEPFFLRGVGFHEEGEHELAKAAFSEAIALDPDYGAAYINRGLCSYMLDDMDAAIEDFNQALAIEYEPDSAQMFVNRGRGKSILDDFEGAIEDFDRAIDLDPGLVEAYVRRANVNGYLEEYDLALADLEYAIELDPDYVLAHEKLGALHRDMENFPEAIESFSTAIELEPEDWYYYFSRGLTYAQSGDYEAGIVDMESVVSMKPDHAYAYYFMGLMCMDSSQPEEAVIHFEKAVDLGLDPDDEEYVLETIDSINNPPEEIVLNPDWLVTPEELNFLTEGSEIVLWELWDHVELEYWVCAAYTGMSWSASPNLSENCVYVLAPGMTLDSTIDALIDMEHLRPGVVEMESRSEIEADFRVLSETLDNGHAYFHMYVIDGRLLYYASLSFGMSIGSTNQGFYNSAGESIDAILYGIIQINQARRSGEAGLPF